MVVLNIFSDMHISVIIIIALLLAALVAFFVRRVSLKNEKARIKQQKVNAKQFPNEKYIPLMCEYLNDTKAVTLNLRGNSMRPFLESDRDVGYLYAVHQVKAGDVVLAEVAEKHYVLHRIDCISFNGRKVMGECAEPDADVTLRGDGNPIGTETCKIRDIRAVCRKVKRNGKLYDLATSKSWKLYSWWWTHTLFLRRYQLVFYRLIWRHELPRRWSKH